MASDIGIRHIMHPTRNTVTDGQNITHVHRLTKTYHQLYSKEKRLSTKYFIEIENFLD